MNTQLLTEEHDMNMNAALRAAKLTVRDHRYYRATHDQTLGVNGAAAYGNGNDFESALADLEETLCWNLTNNGRMVL